MKRKFFIREIFLLAAFLIFAEGCAKGDAMHDAILKLPNFDVNSVPPICGRWRDHMPDVRSKEPYDIYLSARKRWRSKQAWLFDKEENKSILYDVMFSAEKGDWGAKALLANFYRLGLGITSSNHVLDPDPEKSIAIVKTAVEAGQAWGFYDLGVAYEKGYGGVEQSKEIAWALYLKAAKLGSPEALMALADAYGRARRLNEEELMLQCAYKQGFGAAAYQLAVIAKIEGRAMEAVRLYQDGVTFGDSESASALNLIFDTDDGIAKKEEMLKALGSDRDPERARRYKEIYDALDLNRDLRLGRLDKVLPLPPAALPEWHGIEAALTPEPEGPPTY
ncbi:sel1 repeat family protein [Duganella sp. FT92W]|uniref:Sel1 repeat family protein n=1 Tax=Pseudoduganella rivuli TaxID=2666085 RepID=A0A7X2ISB9_9BURK|nr:DUF6396 domain-containing protein [Pseudoduganella rivuli]MRV74588.1 sel1 repeat family protein [Pseudoduganella rivuli]